MRVLGEVESIDVWGRMMIRRMKRQRMHSVEF